MRPAVGVTLAATLLAVVACGWDGDPDATGPGPATLQSGPAAEAAQLQPFTEPVDGGAVEVVDSGMAVHVDDDGGGWLGYGYVLENTSEYVAVDTDIRVDMYDEAGELVGVGVSSFYVGDSVNGRGATDRARATILVPGQQFGSGDLVELPETVPSRMEVTVSGSLWYRPDTPFLDLATVTASGVTTEWTDGDEGCLDLDTLSFTVDSEFTSNQSVRMESVLRDPDGALIGGFHDWWDNENVAEPGTSAMERSPQAGCSIRIRDAYDDVATEIYVQPRSVAYGGSGS